MLKIFCIAVISLMVLSGCQKEVSGELPFVPQANPNWTNTTPGPATHVVRQLLNGFQAPASVNSFLNASGIFLNFGDISVSVPFNCFVKQDNTAVSGMVDLKVKTALKFGEMIFYGLGTITNTELLSTDGMVNLEATQGADILKIAPGKKIEIYFKRNSGNSYQGFAGITLSNAANSTIWNLNSNWQTDSINITQPPGSLSTRIKIDSCQWVNCDYFYNQPNPTNLYLTLPAAFGNTNTLCYILFRTDKVISGMYADAGNQRFWQGSNYKVPIGKSVRLIAISKKDNKNYYGYTDLVIAANQTAAITTMEEVTDLDLQIRLLAL
jgi:hypothetical protein